LPKLPAGHGYRVSIKTNKSQLIKKEPPHYSSPIDGINARVAVSVRQVELRFGL
jgi:hypothetical protein